MVEGVLHAGERLGGIVVFVVDVQVVVLHGLACLVAQEVVVDEGFCRLAGKLHHHASWRVGIHVGVLARHVVVLDVDNLEEDVTRLGPTCYGPLMSVGDILLCHIFSLALHQLHFDAVLYVLHRHLWFAVDRDVVCYLLNEAFVITLLSMQHGLADGSHDFLFVETNDAPVALYYCLYHFRLFFLK